MKNFKRVSALLMALVLVFGLMPALVLAEPSQSVPPVVTPAVGDSVLFAEQVAADDAWEGAGATLSDGTSKIVAAWDEYNLYLIYAEQDGAAATINGEAATVTAGATYDVAKIALGTVAAGIDDYQSYIEAELAIGTLTWEGKIALTKEDYFTLKCGWNCVDPTTPGGNGNGKEYVDTVLKSTGDALNPGGAGGQLIRYRSPSSQVLVADPVVFDFDLDLTNIPVESRMDAELTSAYCYYQKGVAIFLTDPYSRADKNIYNKDLYIPFYFVKNATGLKLLYSDNGTWKLAALDDMTTANVRAEVTYPNYSNTEDATANLKVYVNGELKFVASNARSTLDHASGPNAGIYELLVNLINFDSTNSHSTRNNPVAAEIGVRNATISIVSDETFVAPEPIDPNAPVVGDNFIFAVKGEEADAVWAGAQGQLAAGEKFGIGWYGTCLHIIYAKQGVDAFKVNGKDATVVKGDTYDIAVISYEDLEMEVTSGNGCYPLTLEVNGKTWDGFVVLNDLGEDVVVENNNNGGVTKAGDEYAAYSLWRNGTTSAIEIAANEPVVMDWDINVKELPTSCDPDEITSWRGGWHSGYDYSWVKGISFVLYDPFTADASSGVQKNYIPVSLIKVANGDLYVVYCDNAGQFKNVKLEGVTLDAENGTDLHFRVELTYADATVPTVALKCYVNDTFLFESTDARSPINTGSSPLANKFGMKLHANNYDVVSNNSSHEAWANNKVSEAVEGGALVLGNIEAIDFAMANYTIKTLNADFELPEDPELEIPDPDEEIVVPPTVAQVGDKVVFAEKGAAGDDVWADAKGQLAAGEKFGVAWYGTCFHIIYAKQGVDTFKVNGKDATVIKGDTYDVAVISYEDLGIKVTAANVAYALKLEVNGKTWEGLVALNDLGEDVVDSGNDNGGTSASADEYVAYSLFRYGTAEAIDIVANQPIVMDWDVNVKELPTSCDPDEITSWRGGYKTGYDYSWVKGISFVLCDPFAASAESGVQKRWIPVSLIKVANGDLYVVYCENNQFKNAKLEGVTLDAENGTDLHFRVELSYADAANHTVAMKCYVNDTFLFESVNARNTAINVGSTPKADRFGMRLQGHNYDVVSNDSTDEAWANNKVSEAVEGGALVLGSFEAIDFDMTNYTIKTLNAEFELPQDPAGGAPAPTGDTNEVALYAALLVTSILGMVALAIPTIRKKLF